ncbi:MAG: hypothetical protein UH853_03675 [Muribaculaceae bacterium]|nr:hypothetical protein [Muribaculaceae bacterium]
MTELYYYIIDNTTPSQHRAMLRTYSEMALTREPLALANRTLAGMIADMVSDYDSDYGTDYADECDINDMFDELLGYIPYSSYQL